MKRSCGTCIGVIPVRVIHRCLFLVFISVTCLAGCQTATEYELITVAYNGRDSYEGMIFVRRDGDRTMVQWDVPGWGDEWEADAEELEWYVSEEAAKQFWDRMALIDAITIESSRYPEGWEYISYRCEVSTPEGRTRKFELASETTSVHHSDLWTRRQKLFVLAVKQIADTAFHEEKVYRKALEEENKEAGEFEVIGEEWW